MSKFNRQVLGDQLYLWGLCTRRKPFFFGGLDSPPITEHLRVMDFDMPALPSKGRAEFVVNTLAGPVRAAVHVEALAGPTDPVVIFHHDFGDEPADTVRRTFRNTDGLAMTVLGVEAPFHAHRKEEMTGTAALMAYLTMLSVPVAITQRLLEERVAAQSPFRAVAGFGQGGYVANWHHMLFNSADAYFPFMAGTALADMFLAALPVARAVKRRPQRLRELLNFDSAWKAQTHSNVYPVLGSADLINRFDVQARSYGDTPIEVWNASHLETARHPGRLRDKIVQHLRAQGRVGQSSAA